MNKGIWKFLTILGFLLAVLVLAMILVLRYQIFERAGIYSQEQRGLSVIQTQALTQQLGFSDLDADKKNLARLVQGCLAGNDCISSIDQPEFVSVKQARSFLKEDDLVIGVAFEGWEKEDDPVKAYPVKILNWHEAVNDFVNENPVVVTYCPLCMTPRVYERMFEGKAVDFGVSGMLLNSNLVLYDRDTKSLWSQFDGQALVGPRRGEQLKLYPSQLISWGDWVKKYPTTVVLSEDTGFDLPYDESPYGDYDTIADVYFPLEHADSRLDPKELIFGIVIDGQAKAYPEAELQKALRDEIPLIDSRLRSDVVLSKNDQFAGKTLRLTYDQKTFTVIDEITKEPIPNTISYYFTWAAFYPNTQIYQSPQKVENV